MGNDVSSRDTILTEGDTKVSEAVHLRDWLVIESDGPVKWGVENITLRRAPSVPKLVAMLSSKIHHALNLTRRPNYCHIIRIKQRIDRRWRGLSRGYRQRGGRRGRRDREDTSSTTGSSITEKWRQRVDVYGIQMGTENRTLENTSGGRERVRNKV
jgi:hypothetical protein